MSTASLKAIGQKGLDGIKSIFTTPGSSSLTLVIMFISAKVKPVSGSITLPTASLTLCSSSVSTNLSHSHVCKRVCLTFHINQ